MLPDRVSNPGPLTYEAGALPIALRGPASRIRPWSRIAKAFRAVMLNFSCECCDFFFIRVSLAAILSSFLSYDVAVIHCILRIKLRLEL